LALQINELPDENAKLDLPGAKRRNKRRENRPQEIGVGHDDAPLALDQLKRILGREGSLQLE
jgi:hypothetical protein